MIESILQDLKDVDFDVLNKQRRCKGLGGGVGGGSSKTRKRTVKIDIDKMTTTSVKEAGEDRWSEDVS